MNRTGPFWALVALCILWGTTYSAIRTGMTQGFPPFLFSSFRYLVSGGMILAWFLVRGTLVFPGREQWRHMMFSAVFMFVLGNVFLVMGQRTVHGGIASLVNAGFPIWVVLVTHIWNRSEKTPLLSLFGITVGFTGQWLIFDEHLGSGSTQATLAGLLFLLAGVINGALGSVYMRKHPVDLDPVQTAGWQMFICGFLVGIPGLLLGETTALPTAAKPWMALGYLIVVGSVLGYSLFVYALRHLPAQQVSVYAYVNPLIALLTGNVLMDEPVSGKTLLSMSVVLAGVFLVNEGMRRMRKNAQS